jgi:UDPglucose 6-dehydrogenase
MKVSIVGTGYVGLVTGTCFAEMGNNVTCIDIDSKKIERLNNGESVIYEPGLEEMIKKNVNEKRLVFSNSFEDSIPGSDICFIAVGTPPLEDGSADVSYVLSAAKSIAKNMDRPMVIVNKSTVPIGTGFEVEKIVKANTEYSFSVVSNPEFLKEGQAINDFMRPDRIVIGSSVEWAKNRMTELYSPFVTNGHKIVYTDVISAEMIKYAANAMLATRISFINEIAKLCDKIGGDVKAVREGIGLDSRIGMSFLYASCGYGGSCFPKDVKELIQVGKRNGLDMKIATSVEEVNFDQKNLMFERIWKKYGLDNLVNKQFAIWGLAFKAETDDVRESPSLYLVKSLISFGAKVKCYDPKAEENFKKYFTEEELKNIEFCGMEETLKDSDALIIMTEWRQFKNVDFEKLDFKSKVIFDGRNIFEPENMKKLGIEYHCIGRGLL